jgi:N-acetylmuramic acid 6-phosphate (MurNAc-6-P) etherase
VLVPPSPKFQDHAVTPPVELSVNETASGTVPLVGDAAKFATGNGGATVTVDSKNDDPIALEAVRITA